MTRTRHSIKSLVPTYNIRNNKEEEMKKTVTIIIAIIIASALTLAGAFAGEKMKSETGATSHRASSIIGSTVKNMQDETLGKITDLTVDTQDGRITFAILSQGGVLGIGEKLIPVPMTALSFKDEKTMLLDISKDKLASAPNFEKNKWPDFSSRSWTEDTYRFYGVRPLWKEKGMEMKETEKGMEREMERPERKERPMY